jgi:Nicotinamide mononucleotide transporter
MIQYLEIIVGVLYFANKVLLALNKPSGWYIGISASLCAILYFYMLDSTMLVGLEVSFVLIQALGLFLSGEKTINPKYVYGSIFGLMALLFYLVQNSTWVEFLCSTFFIVGVYLMAIKIKQSAWLLLAIGHCLMAYFTFHKNQYIFMTLQLLSIVVAVYAIYSIYKASKR